jgi:hypothetical protein
MSNCNRSTIIKPAVAVLIIVMGVMAATTASHAADAMSAAVVPPMATTKATSSERPESRNSLAAGHGLDAGIVGIKYQRMLRDGTFAIGIGTGLSLSIVPTLQYNFVHVGNWNAHIQIGAMYTPVSRSVLFSQNSVLAFASVGVQRWAFRSEDFGLFVDASLAGGRLVHGSSEGDRDVGFTPQFHAGVAF